MAENYIKQACRNLCRRILNGIPLEGVELHRR